MRRTLTVLAIAALGAFGPLASGGTAYAACVGTNNVYVCQEDQQCSQSINVCTGAQECSGMVDVCPMAHPDDCRGNVDVCLDFVGP